MLVLLKVSLPHGPFNSLVKDGTVGQKMARILDDLKPKSVYFTEFGGLRTALVVVELESASKIPTLAEPWFLTFHADVEIRPVMTPDDLKAAGLEALGKKWG